MAAVFFPERYSGAVARLAGTEYNPVPRMDPMFLSNCLKKDSRLHALRVKYVV